MGRTVLVTGATGLIGRQTIAPLRELGFTVLAGSRSGVDVEGAPGLACDILDPMAPEQIFKSGLISHLLHLAWHDHPRDRWTSPANLDWAAASLRLVRAFAEAGGTRVVASGSYFLHTGDIGRGLAAILDSQAEGAINLASGEAVEVRALIQEVASQMGHPERVRLGARPRPKDDPAIVEADVTRLREIGFEPEHDLASGVAQVLGQDVS